MLKKASYLLLTGVILLSCLLATGAAIAAEADRGIDLRTIYTSVVADISQEKIELPVRVANTGKQGENISLLVASAPEGWGYYFKSSYPEMVVRALYLPPKSLDEYGFKQELKLIVKPPSKVEAGDYEFTLKAMSADGAIESSLDISITLSGEAAIGGVKLSSMYPVLSGPCGTNFKFSVDLNNESGEDRSFNLSAGAPQGWGTIIKPAWEDKQTPTIHLKANETKGLDIEITPLPWEEPGEYIVTVQASSGAIKDALDLKVILTGSYKLYLSTATGLLNTKATAGKESYLTVHVANSGSADINNIILSSAKPEGWAITFNPDKIESLPAGYTQELNVSIKPAGKSITGDYGITLSASAEQVSETMNLRVAVGTSTAWGLIGVIIIVLVIAGLAVVFTRLGRR
jgi:uncharacterized membrane protein